MRKPLEALLGLLRRLNEAKRSVEAEMEDCLKVFYKLARAKSLTARSERDDDGRIRGIYLAARMRSGRIVGSRRVRNLRRIRGRVTPGLIYKIARDYKNYDQWLTLDNRDSSQLLSYTGSAEGGHNAAHHERLVLGTNRLPFVLSPSKDPVWQPADLGSTK